MYNAMSLMMMLPCMSWLFPLFFGRQLGYVFVTRMTSTLMMITTLITYYYFYQLLGNNNPMNLELFNYLNMDYLDINYNFEMDSLTITMLLAITTISSMVHMYSMGYMETDPHQVRFFSLLSMFTFWMMILVTGSNYFVLFVGWEFIGVTSYLLISYWFTRLQAMKSALSAVLMNRFGDAFFVLGLCVMAYVFGTLNYSTMFATAYLMNTDLLNLMMLALFIAAMAKSAQFGLHNWLTLAMEGPTPVSSLLHAATTVTAGIYLLLRSANMLEYTPTVLLIMLWMGALTTLSAGLMAMCSNDLKRMMALSTMSQLGMMTMAMGLSAYNLALFHLLGHAFFKALLFMSAGSIMHSMLNESQDMRTYGGLLSYLPYTYICMTIASLSLMAMPGLTGYYTKDMIMESTYGSYNISNYVVYWIAYLSAVLTCVYSMKMLYLTFYSNPNNSTITYYNAHESNMYITLPMFMLSMFAMFAGWLLKDIYLGMGTEFVGTNVLPNNFSYYDTEFSMTQFYKLAPLISATLVSMLIVVLNEFFAIMFNLNNKYMNIVYSMFNQKLVSDQVLNHFMMFKGLVTSGNISNHMDRGTLYVLGPVGMNRLLNKASYNIMNLSSNTRSSLSMNSMLMLVTMVSLLLITFVININVLLVMPMLMSMVYILFS
uniref:NADH-ubiquinone oxidoreductase chain 5 n=1 Tax=Yarrowia phangngaensis TaxID=444778 RepID=G4U4W8_9ASCO|nr:NADH dehydrogenase subunit 5 [Yarrowia phangngaensis]CCC29020.1 subunit ND5 of proton translocating NADH:ubiquinone oxidoreductase [Yarrowia phangngaensis]